jgi:hypothetical protein
MTTPEEPKELDHEAGARFLEKLLAEDPAKLCVATDEQVDAMMDAAGIEVGQPDTAEQMLARVERRRRERQATTGGEATRAPRAAPKKTASRVAWVAGAVVAAAAAAVVAVEVAGSRRGPEAIGPEPSSLPREQAALLRREAVAACDVEDFASCTAKLDDAKRLDPSGESEPRVVAARAAIAASPASTPEPQAPKPQGDKPKPP